jgi:hypothetical protein
MNKYLLFILINYFLIISPIDRKIMIEYICRSIKYLNVYSNTESNIFIKLIAFRIVFLFLFLIYPLIALLKAIKNKSFKLFLFYLKHPIAIFDPTLKSYNLYFQKKELHEGQNENYWKLLFKYYKYPFLEENDNKKTNIIKVFVAEDEVKSIILDKYEIQENYIENIFTGKKLKNNLPANILNSIVISSVSIHQKIKSKFKMIELTVHVIDNKFYFVSGNSNPSLVNVNDKNYIHKSKEIINFLHNPKQSS